MYRNRLRDAALIVSAGLLAITMYSVNARVRSASEARQAEEAQPDQWEEAYFGEYVEPLVRKGIYIEHKGGGRQRIGGIETRIAHPDHDTAMMNVDAAAHTPLGKLQYLSQQRIRRGKGILDLAATIRLGENVVRVKGVRIGAVFLVQITGDLFEKPYEAEWPAKQVSASPAFSPFLPKESESGPDTEGTGRGEGSEPGRRGKFVREIVFFDPAAFVTRKVRVIELGEEVVGISGRLVTCRHFVATGAPTGRLEAYYGPDGRLLLERAAFGPFMLTLERENKER